MFPNILKHKTVTMAPNFTNPVVAAYTVPVSHYNNKALCNSVLNYMAYCL